MNANLIGRTMSVLVISLLLGVAACSRQSSVETQADVSKAQAEGTSDVAKAQTDAVDATADARKDVAEARTDLAHDAASAQEDVDVTSAEAAHKVALARCGGLESSLRNTCEKEADAQLAAAKARAESRRSVADPSK